MAPKKRQRESPVKGQDKCPGCAKGLDENSQAVNCDKCPNWFCIECLGLSDEQYVLLEKMNRTMTCEWSCPRCILNKPVRDADTLTKAIESFKSEVREDIASITTTVNKGLREIHDELATKCNVLEVKAIVESAITAQVTGLAPEALDEHIRRTVRSEQDRQRRKLNVVGYGIPIQASDEDFLAKYFKDNYKLATKVFNVKRLPASAPTAGQPLRHPPVLFTVASFTDKKLILDASYQRKDPIRFYGDSSKEDRNARKALLEEMKKRQANGETDLVIRKGKITKNGQTRAIPMERCSSMQK